jgi:tRNA threonylcarbamoyl adenosine modification protein YeaZ
VILGIDTSGARCAVAVLAGEHVARREQAMERGHAEALMPMIEATLAEARAGHRDLTRIAVCTGPGSFTGIRIGIAAARGLALGLGIPAIGITRLEALAAAAAPGRPCAVRVPGPSGASYLQEFDALRRPESPARLVGPDWVPPPGHIVVGPGGLVPDALADPEVIARLAAARPAGARPAPLYLRDTGAAPPREAPPPLLDA